MTIKGLTDQCCLVAPMSLSKDTFPLKNNFRKLPFSLYKPESHYHTSAILASAIDTMTLPWRSRRNKIDMTEISSKLNLNGRKVAATAISLPFPLKSDEFLVQFLEKIENERACKTGNFHESVNLVSLMPGCHNVTKDIQLESMSLRGIDVKERFKPKRDMQSTKMPAYTGKYALTDSIPHALFSHFAKMKERGRENMNIPNSISSIDSSLPTECPFPHLFDKSGVTENGFLIQDGQEKNSG